MTTTTLLLVRHGEAEGNADGRFIGQRDVALTDAGRRQADRLVDRFRGVALIAVVSSDLTRCIDTVRPVSADHELAVATDRRLREICNGAWSGLLPDDLAAGWPEMYGRYRAGEDVARPGGETWAMVAERVAAALTEIARTAEPGGVVLVGSHAGPITAAARWAAGIAAEGSVFDCGLGPVSNTGITTLRFPGPHLVEFNDDAHLPEFERARR